MLPPPAPMVCRSIVRVRTGKPPISRWLVWAGFSALTGLATGLLSLGVARAGSGLGQGVNDPVHRGLLSDYYPLSDRPKAFAVHGGARRLGQLLGFLLAGGLAAWLGWRAPFLLFAVPGFVLALVRRDRGLLRVAYPFGPFLVLGALVGLCLGPGVLGSLTGA